MTINKQNIKSQIEMTQTFKYGSNKEVARVYRVMWANENFVALKETDNGDFSRLFEVSYERINTWKNVKTTDAN